MREQLLGYLLGALDAPEHLAVESELKKNSHLQQEMELLAASLAPLEADQQPYLPREGLAESTAAFVTLCARKLPASSADVHATSGNRSPWSMLDVVVAAGVCLAASLLFIPAIANSQYQARLLGCQNNLHTIGVALHQFSENNRGNFPQSPASGNLAAAGYYAPVLIRDGYIQDEAVFLCPARPLAIPRKNDAGTGVAGTGVAGMGPASKPLPRTIPTLDELLAAKGAILAELQHRMGGHYGYNLGVVIDGRLHPVRNQGRATFALVADSPRSSGQQSRNHDRRGQNVLFEDGHIRYVVGCGDQECGLDDLFLNDDGVVAPGVHPNDAVISASHVRPIFVRAKP